LFAEGLQRAGYAIEIIQVDLAQTHAELIRTLRKHALDGLVFLNWPTELLEKPLVALIEREVPTVASGTAFLDAECTWTDVDAQASWEEAIVQFGHEGRGRIAMIDNVIVYQGVDLSARM
jgi:DNA-binding LacI/PurR family transcriptional regulator